MMSANLSRIIIPNPQACLIYNPLGFIEDVTKQVGPALVIIDPVVAFTGKADTSKAWEVREFMAPLMVLANQRGFALILVCHLNKQNASKAMYRNSGSIDFVAACRSCFIVAEDPDEPGLRVLAHIKNSLAPRQPSLSFYIDKNGFRWGDEVDVTADELLGPNVTRNRERRQLETAKKFLEQILANGPMLS